MPTSEWAHPPALLLLLLLCRVPAPARALPAQCLEAVPSLTRSPGGPSTPGAPCGETTGAVRRWGWPASMHGGHRGHGQRTHLITRLSYRSRLTLVSRRALGEQATGVQMRQVSRFRSKGLHTCRASGKLCSKPRLAQGSSPSHSGQRMLPHGCFTHLLSGAAGNPLSARFSVVPRLPLHKDTRHRQDCIQCPWHRGRQEPRCTPSPFLGCGLSPGTSPSPADPPPLHLPSMNHLFTAAPQYFRDARARLVGTHEPPARWESHRPDLTGRDGQPPVNNSFACIHYGYGRK